MRLFDNHVHTHFAFCTDNDMFPETTIEIAKKKGCRICITEHAGHLYTTKPRYTSDEFVDTPELLYDKENDRMDSYIDYISRLKEENVYFGAEVEVFSNGELTLKKQHRDRWDILLGAIHFMPKKYADDYAEGFLWTIEAFSKCGVDVLAHPYRIFSWKGRKVPKETYKPAVELLKKGGMAAELNFHYNSPDKEFFTMCVENGVKISLGSDSHSLFEVCDLVPHVKMLKEICGEDFYSVLYKPESRKEE